jgi:glycosyltransferase involved in cell wall biosynthesis
MAIIRLCVLIPDFADGGAQRQCAFLINELEYRPEISILLIRYRHAVHDRLLDETNVNVHLLRANSNYDLRAIGEIVRMVRANDCNILMSWLHSSDILGYVVARSVPGLTWLMTERNSRYPRGLRFAVRKHLGSRADCIVSNSLAGDLYWSNARPRFGRHVVDNIMPTNCFESNCADRDLVLTIGRLEHQKNPVRQATALCALARRDNGISCAIVGDGSLRNKVAEVISAWEVGDRVRMLGFRAYVPSLLRRARVLLSLSEYEGQPNVLIEGISAGVPVVASAIPEHVELLGRQYPYFVGRSASATEIAAMIVTASRCCDLPGVLAFAQNRISKMTPKVVGDSYLSIMKGMI